MSFPSLAVLLLLNVASLAAVDPSLLALNDLPPNPLLNDPSDNSMISPVNEANNLPLLVPGANNADNSPLLVPGANPPNDAFNSPPTLTAGATTFPHDMLTTDVLAPEMAVGTDGAGVTNPGNSQIPDGASAICITDAPNAQRRVRRGCVTIPSIPPPVESPQNSPGQDDNGEDGSKPANPNSQPLEMPNPELPMYVPGPDRKFPMKVPEPEQRWKLGQDGKLQKVEWLCNPFGYRDLGYPMCDSGNKGEDIIWSGFFGLRTLYRAHPWIETIGCISPEDLWCCNDVTVSRPFQNMIGDLYHWFIYTGLRCRQYVSERP